MRLLLGTTALMSVTTASVAFAQTVPAPEAGGQLPSASAASATTQTEATPGLGDIVITAQRREESLQRAAIAVDVVKGGDLVSAGVNQINRLGELVPALTIQPTSTGNVLFIRGVGNFTNTPNSDPAVAFNYDGVYVGRSTSTTGVFYDLERVEVLKGPQGILYGRNATGGAINVIPVQPHLGEWSGYATLGGGNYGAVVAEGAVNAPLGQYGAIRLSGSVSRHDGYLRDGTDDDRTQALRGQIKYKVTPELTLRIAADYSHTGGVGTGGDSVGVYSYNPAAGNYTFTPSNVPVANGSYTAIEQNYRQTVQAATAGRPLDVLAPYPYQHNTYVGTNAQIDWNVGFGTLTVIPAYRHASLDYLSDAVAFTYKQKEKDEQFSAEVRLAGKRIGIFDYQVGFYYYHENIKVQTALTLSSVLVLTNPNYVTHSIAPFGRLVANLTDRLRLVGGLRYTDDHKRFDGPSLAGVVVCVLRTGCPNAALFPLVTNTALLPFAFPPPGTFAVPQIVGGVPTGAIVARVDQAFNGHLSNSRATYRVAAEFDVAPRSLLYASYETGYRSGGFSSAAGFETFQPEYIDALTVGLKSRFLDNRLQLNLEGFYWKYRNQQVNHVALDANGSTANITQNIGRTRIAGIEADGRALVTPTVLVSANVQYLSTRDESFVFAQPYATGGALPISGCAVTPASATLTTVDCSGKPAYNSPRWTINLGAQKTFKVEGYDLVLQANSQYLSSRYIGFLYLPEDLIRPNWNTDVQASFGPGSGRWSLSLFARNLENNRVPFFAALHPSTLIQVFDRSAPRTYGARASVKF